LMAFASNYGIYVPQDMDISSIMTMEIKLHRMARDLFHAIVKDALIKEGWQITHDPFPVDYGDVQMQIDLGAERLIAATKDREKIAVEVKSFINPPPSLNFIPQLDST
jgi:XisH protein